MKPLYTKAFLGCVVFFISGCQTITHNDYIQSGLLHKKQGDLNAAIADFSRAVELDPKNPYVYMERGIAYEESDNLQAAERDFTVALQLNPNDSLYYVQRGDVRRAMVDLDGAIADYTRAIALAPRDTLGYWCRGYAKFDQGDFAAAETDYSFALDLNRQDASSYRARASFRFKSGNFSGALNDYQDALHLSKTDTLTPNFHVYLIQLKLGLPVDQGKLFKTVNQWPNEWPQPVGRYLSGAISETEFLSLAQKGDANTTRDHGCDYYYYTGAIHLLKGDLSGAQQLFSQCIATGLKHSVEYNFAKAELARMATNKQANQNSMHR